MSVGCLEQGALKRPQRKPCSLAYCQGNLDVAETEVEKYPPPFFFFSNREIGKGNLKVEAAPRPLEP